VEAETGYVVEDIVGREERRADMDSGSRDPQVVGVQRLVQRMPSLSTGVAELCRRRQESVTDGDDRGCCDRLLQPWAALLAQPATRAP
jgi:hypothetical protein